MGRKVLFVGYGTTQGRGPGRQSQPGCHTLPHLFRSHRRPGHTRPAAKGHSGTTRRGAIGPVPSRRPVDRRSERHPPSHEMEPVLIAQLVPFIPAERRPCLRVSKTEKRSVHDAVSREATDALSRYARDPCRCVPKSASSLSQSDSQRMTLRAPSAPASLRSSVAQNDARTNVFFRVYPEDESTRAHNRIAICHTEALQLLAARMRAPHVARGTDDADVDDGGHVRHIPPQTIQHVRGAQYTFCIPLAHLIFCRPWLGIFPKRMK